MIRGVVRGVALLVFVALVGEMLTPPLSCWVTKSLRASDATPTGEQFMQPDGGVGPTLRRLLEPPSETSGRVCREQLARIFRLP